MSKSSKKFAKAAFDLDTILNTANDLKYTRAIQNRLAEWMLNPSDEFVRLVSGDLVGSRRFTPVLKDQFTLITKRAFEQLVGERINDRLKGAMTSEAPAPQEEAVPIIPSPNAAAEAQIVTSSEELEGFHSVRAILRGLVNPKRVVMRDAQSYCAILLDDNNRKPICRLRFNNTQRLQLGLFNDAKDEERMPLDSVDDIFNFADQLKATLQGYLPTGEAPKVRMRSDCLGNLADPLGDLRPSADALGSARQQPGGLGLHNAENPASINGTLRPNASINSARMKVAFNGNF